MRERAFSLVNGFVFVNTILSSLFAVMLWFEDMSDVLGA